MQSRLRLSAALLLFLPAVPLWSQALPPKAQSNPAAPARVPALDIKGDWQGTLKVGETANLRLVLQIAKKPGGGYTANFYSIDQGTAPIPVDEITLKGTHLHFSVPAVQGYYDGVLQAGGRTIRGRWTQDGAGPLDLERPTPANKWPTDTSPHKVSFVPVAPGVKLEVLDWGGTGRPLVLLAGLGDDAHVFDKFALKLTSQYHVVGITRRGFGTSSHPDAANVANYTADRLGDDVLAVLAALKLKNPVVAGHSIAGEELSSIGSRHPERVAGLIYLDAGYQYAFYDPVRGDYSIDLYDLRKKLAQLKPDTSSQDELTILKQVLAGLPRFERDVLNQEELDAATPDDPPSPSVSQPQPGAPSPPSSEDAVMLGQEKYTSLPVPILAIFADPHKLDPTDPKASPAAQAIFAKYTTATADSFEHGVPTAKVVRIKDADHYVFLSNEADVIREINTFIATLP